MVSQPEVRRAHLTKDVVLGSLTIVATTSEIGCSQRMLKVLNNAGDTSDGSHISGSRDLYQIGILLLSWGVCVCWCVYVCMEAKGQPWVSFFRGYLHCLVRSYWPKVS